MGPLGELIHEDWALRSGSHALGRETPEFPGPAPSPLLSETTAETAVICEPGRQPTPGDRMSRGLFSDPQTPRTVRSQFPVFTHPLAHGVSLSRPKGTIKKEKTGPKCSHLCLTHVTKLRLRLPDFITVTTAPRVKS
ncbi:hypothetical protein HJG60_009161 [Phyllostomus discolor]|uniref:Uncharacterized protein n=1 Tax=Phyllostomus discolor TaxID=89673 RepID=A0A834DFU1_9CHIR|nr:hypothetical protein HJG60_009161 [Phyllostomus discolor]